MSPTIGLFDAATIEQLPWPETDDGTYARSYLQPLIQQGTKAFIENVKTTFMALLVDGQIVLPLTLNERDYKNSYVCSPYAHYVAYAKEELGLLEQRGLRAGLSLLIDGFGILCKFSRINQAIHINNWLLSTNLYPELTSEQVNAIIEYIKGRFPRHTIIFRSLNGYSNAALLANLKNAGCKLVGSRQVYLLQPADPTFISAKARWLLKRDFALLARHGYSIVEGNTLEDHEVPRIVELYTALYLKKYSYYNPMFSAQFIRLALQQNILHIVALKKEGRIDAVLGYFCRNGIMTTPLFGYDTTLPQETGLYRMLSVVLFNIAKQNGHLLNESSGVAQFKRNRGAVGEIEYSAIYNRHLPWSRRLCWTFLRSIVNTLGIPLVKKYKF